MLQTWTVRNFKSYREPGSVKLKSINVLAGANSSGKSTIIQSLLLLKQTVQYGSQNRALTLNGPLLRLGSFDDILNVKAESEGLDLAIGFDFSSENNSSAKSSWIRSLNRRIGIGGSAEQFDRIDLKLQFLDEDSTHLDIFGSSPLSSINPLLSSIYLSLDKGGDERGTRSFIRMDKVMEHEEDELEFSFPYRVSMDTRSEDEICSQRPQSEIIGAYNNQFLPSWVGVKYNEKIRRIQSVIESVFTPTVMGSSNRQLENFLLPDEAISLANAWFLEEEIEEQLVGHATALDLRKAIEPLINKTSYISALLGQITNGRSENAKEQVEALRRQIHGALVDTAEPEFEVDPVTPSEIERASDFVRDYLKEGVRYLGPLRDSPRPVYQPEALESTTDVGYRGEHTAAILEINSHRRIRYYVPPSLSLDKEWAEKREGRLASLHDAVVDWLDYLGVAGEVKTTDAGVYGNRLQVTTGNSAHLHDLTNVGVGVSQVLPIVVMSLLAPRGSLLIFEQPELHLHPKVQARLADFFISLSWDDKQTLLETHSEYLIDRFRLRIALEEEPSVLDSVNVLFSEKVGDETKLRSVELSEFGSVIDWPEDFFDQSQRDVGQIIKAAAAKRRRKD